MNLDIERLLEEKAPLIDKAIEKYIPRIFSKKALIFKVNPPKYAYNIEAINKAVAEPIWEFLDRGGKRWRPTLFLLICEALGKNPEEYVDYAIIPEVVHNGTLMIDDIEDASELRRGKPCTYKIYGLDVAVNAGNTMYYLPLLPLMENRQKIGTEKLAKVYEIYVQEMISLSLGQAMDIAWHKGLANADQIGEKEYLQMCAYKTGTLARMAAKIAAVLADADDELVEKLGHFAESIGVAFQIQDDVLDLTGEEFAEKKGGRGQDITEGKRTLMVIHTLKVSKAQDKRRLIEILKMHTSDQKLRDEAIAIMQKYGSIDYAKNFARKILEESWKNVEKLLPESEAKEKLNVFARFLIERKI
ncbi:MAG: polyprenyl synthetase family protein [Candidatus Bathyarchaeota archaeon]|nr:polyprenyl synthetase family protein [Candidatus Bathyarchaeota archaeon A05DMB-3]MDH7607175.1 polyprenyl synthetase family protein [Candidatus Bathyarchaeota archaeon]